MNKLEIALSNCFGIESINYEFNFEDDNVYSIYARNGLMKTSFAKTFQLIQHGKAEEISDAIFGDIGQALVKVDDQDIEPNQVFVIKSYESAYESDISSLLIKGDIQTQLQEVFKARTKFLKALEKNSGLKIKRILQGNTVFELEPTIISDFGFEEKDLLSNLELLQNYESEIDCSDIVYTSIFDTSVLRKITDRKFQEGIQEYVASSDEIYDSFGYLGKGSLTLPKLKDLKKALNKDAFFTRDNKVLLSGEEAVSSLTELESHIIAIETKIQEMPAYKAIENLLSDAKGTILKDVIETHPEVIEFLALDKLPLLKKCLWKSYIDSNNHLFRDLCNKYMEFSEAMDVLELDDTPWKEALDIFNQRFTVPFEMEIVNLKGAIIGENVPQVQFKFQKGEQTKTVNRNELEKLDTLSQGEKRALYLLNIIFDLEQLKNSGQEVLLIVDDIADSFDYKNKYAIIEYLYEISQEPNFYMLILSHNFDFYRTVASRLGINRHKRLMADLSHGTLQLEEEHYQKNPFQAWKKNPNEKYIFALLPFVRNMIEFTIDADSLKTNPEYLLLTSLLHEKNDSYSIKFSDVEPIYQSYAGVTNFDNNVERDNIFLNQLYELCEQLTLEDTLLENKIILAIVIRHKAEQYMIDRISTYTGTLTTGKRGERVNATAYLEKVQSKGNQTNVLFSGFKQFAPREEIAVLNEVNIMTPEHIHVNSFMYEPLLDMDIVELHNLYHRVKDLIGEE